MQTDNKLINITLGATVGAVLAIALAVVAFDPARSPKFWAYMFLGLILFLILIQIGLLVWRYLRGLIVKAQIRKLRFRSRFLWQAW